MEPGLLESREAQLREHALTLARDLGEAIYRDSKMPQVKEKMRELMELVTQLEGKEVARQVGEDGTVRFHAGDSSKPYRDGRMHSLEYAVKDENGREQVKLLSFVDLDGGSMVMQREVPAAQNKQWAIDEAYTEDLRSMGTGYHHPDLPVLINRFRELRLVARMAQLVLGAKEQEVAPTRNKEKDIEGVAGDVQKAVGDIAEK